MRVSLYESEIWRRAPEKPWVGFVFPSEVIVNPMGDRLRYLGRVYLYDPQRDSRVWVKYTDRDGFQVAGEFNFRTVESFLGEVERGWAEFDDGLIPDWIAEECLASFLSNEARLRLRDEATQTRLVYQGAPVWMYSSVDLSNGVRFESAILAAQALTLSATRPGPPPPPVTSDDIEAFDSFWSRLE